jgi:hypothetical protein
MKRGEMKMSVTPMQRHRILQTYNSKKAQSMEKPSVYTAKKYDVPQQVVAAVVRHHRDES